MDFYRFILFIATVTSVQIILSSCDGDQLLLIMEQIELCEYFGGHCAVGSCHSRELVHIWEEINLCHNSRKCCAGEPTTTTTSATISNLVPAASEHLNECRSQNGVCQAWYNNCSGTVAQHGCDNVWESCCMPPLQQQSVGSEANTPSLSTPHSTEPQSNPEEDNEIQQESSSRAKSAPGPDLNLGHQRLIPGRCGQQTRAARQKRIVGGSLSMSGTWPWHVGISSALGYIHCAGTIIHDRWILTAAHCFKRIRDYSLYRVVTGTHPDETQKSYSIKRVIKHSLYREHDHVGQGHVGHSHKYDIALVELNEAITYTDVVQPSCLPTTTDVFEGRTCWLTGWGSTRYNSTEDDFRLRHVRGTVLSRSACEAHWGNLVDRKMLCFGNERRGGCTGDSGGGMFCQNTDGNYMIAGVISWGSAQCNEGATVLTDIAQYHAWIQSTMDG